MLPPQVGNPAYLPRLRRESESAETSILLAAYQMVDRSVVVAGQVTYLGMAAREPATSQAGAALLVAAAVTAPQLAQVPVEMAFLVAAPAPAFFRAAGYLTPRCQQQVKKADFLSTLSALAAAEGLQQRLLESVGLTAAVAGLLPTGVIRAAALDLAALPLTAWLLWSGKNENSTSK
jgi:hypothetical protein